MNNEEAIERLTYIKTHDTDPEDYELFDLAIKALEKSEVKGDLISREALKKCARVVFDKDLGRLRVVDVSDIDNAPTVEERPIRCKDCKHTVLSEDGKTLICCLTMKVGTVRPNFYCGNGEMKGGAE